MKTLTKARSCATSRTGQSTPSPRGPTAGSPREAAQERDYTEAAAGPHHASNNMAAPAGSHPSRRSHDMAAAVVGRTRADAAPTQDGAPGSTRTLCAAHAHARGAEALGGVEFLPRGVQSRRDGRVPTVRGGGERPVAPRRGRATSTTSGAGRVPVRRTGIIVGLAMKPPSSRRGPSSSPPSPSPSPSRSRGGASRRRRRRSSRPRRRT